MRTKKKISLPSFKDKQKAVGWPAYQQTAVGDDYLSAVTPQSHK